MPRAKLNKLYRTFVKGLITEASPLTFPADSSIGELNTVLSRKGNRTRRRGIRYEEDYQFNTIPDVGTYDAVNEYVWQSVAKIQGQSITVIQIGDKVHFWNMDTLPLSDNKLSFILDLKLFKAPTANVLDIKNQICMFSSGNGFLFIAHPMCDPIVVQQDTVTKTLTAVKVVIQIRDFDGVYDGLANDEEPSTLSKEHHYNLLNQGWLGPNETIYPALADYGTETPPVPVPVDNGGSSTYYDPYSGESTPYYPSGGRFGYDLNQADRF